MLTTLCECTSICPVVKIKMQSPLGQYYLFNHSQVPPLSFIILGCIPCLSCTSFSVLGHKQKSHINHKSGELLQRVVTYTDKMMMIRISNKTQFTSVWCFRTKAFEIAFQVAIPLYGETGSS